MGTTIHIEGQLELKEQINEIVNTAIKFSEPLGWKIEQINEINLLGIILYPHEKSEPIRLVFDQKLYLYEHIKTVFAPLEIHKMIVKLLSQINPFFTKINISDESGVWDDYQEFGEEIFNNIQTSNIFRLDSLEKVDMNEIKIGHIIPSTAEEVDKWFWNEDLFPSTLHFPTIRDLMRIDLSRKRSSLISVPEIAKLVEEEGIGTNMGFEEKRPEHPLMLMSELWVWNATIRKRTDRSKCISFSMVITQLCLGCFEGMYLDKIHRQSIRMASEWKGDTLAPVETLKVFKGILELYKFERII